MKSPQQILVIAALSAFLQCSIGIPVDDTKDQQAALNPPNDLNDPSKAPSSEPDPTNFDDFLKTPPPGDYGRYVALGDSYSAGPGARPSAPIDGKSTTTGNPCYRTKGGWPFKLKDILRIPDDKFQFSPCTGLNTEQIRNDQIKDVNSKFLDEDGNGPDLVTLTTGGNDGNSFANVVINCPYVSGGTFGFFTGRCDDALEKARVQLEGAPELMDIEQTLQAILDAGNRSKKLKVIVMGYPKLYNDKTGQVGNCYLDAERRGKINDLVEILNQSILAEAVRTFNAKGMGTFIFADPNANPDSPDDPTFNDHRFCEEKTWAYLQGSPNWSRYLTSSWWSSVEQDFLNGLFHPTNAGMGVMAATASSALKKATT